MLPSSPYTMIKLSKTTSPNELLHNDYATLYNIRLNKNWQIAIIKKEAHSPFLMFTIHPKWMFCHFSSDKLDEIETKYTRLILKLVLWLWLYCNLLFPENNWFSRFYQIIFFFVPTNISTKIISTFSIEFRGTKYSLNSLLELYLYSLSMHVFQPRHSLLDVLLVRRLLHAT